VTVRARGENSQPKKIRGKVSGQHPCAPMCRWEVNPMPGPRLLVQTFRLSISGSWPCNPHEPWPLPLRVAAGEARGKPAPQYRPNVQAPPASRTDRATDRHSVKTRSLGPARIHVAPSSRSPVSRSDGSAGHDEAPTSASLPARMTRRRRRGTGRSPPGRSTPFSGFNGCSRYPTTRGATSAPCGSLGP